MKGTLRRILLIVLLIITLSPLAGATEFYEVIGSLISDPEGLIITVGMGMISFETIGMLLDQSVDDDVEGYSEYIRPKTTSLYGFRLGLEMGNSYVDVRLSPYMGNENDCLYIETTSGIWFFNEAEDDFLFKAGISFYGNMLSFTQPLVNSYTSGDSQNLLQMGGGLGIVHVGVSVNLLLGFSIGGFTISLGGFAEMGAILPYGLMLDIGVLGPNVEFAFTDNLIIYADMKPWKYTVEMTHFEGGIRIKF
ncbi:MAG: hypothetical protein JW969_14010 [Spirochaetales bacterium]|nr:hypothetical protein [Spirochaetales bacterium]